MSLLDLAGREAVSWYACYSNRENPRWWNRFLKPGFQHVQIRREVRFGPEICDVMWIVVDPCLSHIAVDLRGVEAAPWIDPEVLHSQRVELAPNWRRVREWFFFGPVTCTEVAKAGLGISSWRIRTPWQLYKYLRKRGCVLR
ncbi:MAG: hypothetical protein ACREXP_00055 [Steroidobacteraceae bacterium]